MVLPPTKEEPFRKFWSHPPYAGLPSSTSATSRPRHAGRGPEIWSGRYRSHFGKVVARRTYGLVVWSRAQGERGADGGDPPPRARRGPPRVRRPRLRGRDCEAPRGGDRPVARGDLPPLPRQGGAVPRPGRGGRRRGGRAGRRLRPGRGHAPVAR